VNIHHWISGSVELGHIIAQDVWDRDVFIKEECQTTKLTFSNKLLETIATWVLLHITYASIWGTKMDL